MNNSVLVWLDTSAEVELSDPPHSHVILRTTDGSSAVTLIFKSREAAEQCIAALKLEIEFQQGVRG